MKIVYLTQRLPFPLDNGGNVRSFHVLRALAVDHEVHLIAEQPAQSPTHDFGPLLTLCSSVELVPSKKKTLLGELIRGAISLAGSAPYVLTRQYNVELQRVLDQRLRAGVIDVVHVNHLDAALYLRPYKAMQSYVIDAHNVVTTQVERTLPLETTLVRRMALRADLAKVKNYEAQLSNDSRHVMACSAVDAIALRKLGVTTPITVVPNGVDTESFSFRIKLPETNRDLVFVGALDYDPCDRAMQFFCTEILPVVLRESPTTRLFVVGRSPSAKLRAIAAHSPAVKLLGRVEDVRAHVSAASVCVVPILSGSGTRLKILEAMALGVPVVSTSIGAEGISAANEQEILLADEPQDFARAVVRLIHDRELANRLARNGRLLVERDYSWKLAGDLVRATYRSIAGAA